MIRIFGSTKLSNAELRAQLAPHFAETTGRYAGAVVRLFKNNITPDRSTVLADLEQAAFAGYAAEAITWGAPFTDENDAANVVGASVQFQASGAVDPAETIYGYYVTNAAGDTLYWAERFDQVKEITGAADAIIVVPGIKLDHGE